MIVALTKFGHSCILVTMPKDGKLRSVLFDPGVWSDVPVQSIEWVDDIVISHGHPDHCDVAVIQTLQQKFPDTRVTAPSDTLETLRTAGISHASDVVPEGFRSFMSPHEEIAPFGTRTPGQVGYHYLETYTHPGDSHSFRESCAILALPITAPWGSTKRALEVALDLKPRYVLPVHDWFLSPEARDWMYGALEGVLSGQGITLLCPENGVPLTVDL